MIVELPVDKDIAWNGRDLIWNTNPAVSWANKYINK